ncbi:hypothetical protein BZG36_03991 [Bifiguratus adelaidae]|uniref:DUF2423 domain-containing protein n=1 Tax=Bifiguratus adelaidae TaxID=1938954 RepID=A0A261Y1P8_9FUNG|nr:hypothetical protein BZG36_03991 [Bifiguratus adelaidae]
MAKGLRAKSKVRARGIKRKAIFDPVEQARLNRLSKKLEVKTDGDAMMQDGDKKISTSGPRSDKHKKRLAKQKRSKTTF